MFPFNYFSLHLVKIMNNLKFRMKITFLINSVKV